MVAKQQNNKSGTSRIRFIMLEAEIPEGDLSQITMAIQNALKPTSMVVQQRLPNSAQGALAAGNAGDTGIDGEVVDPSEELVEEPPARPVRDSKPRKPVVPKAVEIDFVSGTSFESFANKYSPDTDVDRFLVVLAWFKDYRPDEKVTASHVYTCYRMMKWSVAISDFGQPLRNLKQRQLVTSQGSGQYAINQLGLARVDELGKAS